MSSLLQPAERTRYSEQFAAIRRMPTPTPPDERFRSSIEDVGIGGYLAFEGATYAVAGINYYERQGARWPELSLYRLNDGSTQYLEWEKDDTISVYVSREVLSFAQVGLRNKEHLWEISEAERGTVRHGGAAFEYYEDSEVTFFRDGRGDGKPFHQYLFAEAGIRRFVAIEEWGSDGEGYEHNVILSAYLDPKAIEVIVTKGSSD